MENANSAAGRLRASGNRVLSFLVMAFLFMPSVSGAVLINEIMYDLSGSDTGREWIEIYNNGSDINLSG
jgi:hypothetical protein